MSPITNNFNGPNYGDFYQAEGDINISSTAEARVAAKKLRAALHEAALPRETAVTAARELEQIELELRKPQPDRQRIARPLERLTATLKTAGALASAGAALIGPIGVLAGFLGPLGETAVKLARR